MSMFEPLFSGKMQAPHQPALSSSIGYQRAYYSCRCMPPQAHRELSSKAALWHRLGTCYTAIGGSPLCVALHCQRRKQRHMMCLVDNARSVLRQWCTSELAAAVLVPRASLIQARLCEQKNQCQTGSGMHNQWTVQ